MGSVSPTSSRRGSESRGDVKKTSDQTFAKSQWEKRQKLREETKKNKYAFPKFFDRAPKKTRSVILSSTDGMDSAEAREIVKDILVEMRKAREEDRLLSKDEKDQTNRRKLYKLLAFKWHPDKNLDKFELATDVFQWIQKQKEWLLPL